MLRTPITIGICALFILLGIAIWSPTLGTNIVNRVLGVFVEQPSAVAELPTAEIPSTDDIEKGNFMSLFQGSAQTDAQRGDSLNTENIIIDTNKERVKANLPPLKTNAKLNASAKIKVEDMIKRQYFEHESPTGEGVSDLGTQVGYVYVIMGENLALGNFSSSTDLLNAWMNSPGHRANILNPSYQEIGVYAVKGTYQGKVVWFAVQHFGTARAVCPSISQTLKQEIDSINLELQHREAQLKSLREDIEDPDHPEGEEYSGMIAFFNKKVAEYNNLRDVSEQKIIAYNTQVAAFNKCLAGYQKK
jgi:uncharacterized protein YkwD